MSLFDMIEEMNQRQITKTETGDLRLYGLMIGVVTINYHEQMPGRVCVSIPTRDEKLNELKWARLAMLSGGPKWGTYFLPEVGDQVLLAFEGGNIESPYVVGCVPKDDSTFLTGSANEKNEIKRIVTKHGNSITFFDSRENDKGEEDTIAVETAGQAHRIVMDNKEQTIQITDKAGKNFIKLQTKEDDGRITIQTTNQLTIKVGDNIELTMNGDSGAVSLKASQISMESKDGTTIKSKSGVTIEGSQIKNKATDSFVAESGGSAKLEGAMVSIG